MVEPDGTPRMIISDRASFPGMIVQGKEKPYKRPFAGMLFYNDEGTETGKEGWHSVDTRMLKVKF